MAIAPIDLQTLFTQLDKVGKTHLTQKEGQPLQSIMQTIQSQKKDEELINQINETQNMGDGTEKINDNSRRQHEEQEGEKREHEEKEEQKKVSVLTDPSLGKKIDISL